MSTLAHVMYSYIQLHVVVHVVHITCTFLVRNYKVLLHNKTIVIFYGVSWLGIQENGTHEMQTSRTYISYMKSRLTE